MKTFMKKQLTLLFLILLPLSLMAQEKMAVVTLKNGTELKGVIKSIDPTDALKIEIAGFETSIKMDNIAKVEELKEGVNPVQSSQLTSTEKLVVTDKDDYDDVINIKVGNEIVRMILVRGGDMNMGFDGPDSQDMKSEPVHKVTVTSFYISENFITTKLVNELLGENKKSSNTYYMAGWKKVNTIANKIAEVSGLPLRMPTEAEWEFAACSKQQTTIFSTCKDEEYCSDLYGDFNAMDYLVDPTGPQEGRRHVNRYFGENNKKFDRSQSTWLSYFRLVIKAKDIPK